MSLIDFYQRAEKYIITDIIHTYRMDNFRILNIFDSKYPYLVETLPSIYNLGIGDNAERFLQDKEMYIKSLYGKQFDIINCRFSLKYFLINLDVLLDYLQFITDRLKVDGIFTGFMLDTEKLDTIFSKTPKLERGNYSIEISREYNDENTIKMVFVNDEICFVIDKSKFNLICSRFGLRNLIYTGMDEIYSKQFSKIKLSSAEKKFGMLNTSFMFKKD